MSYLRGVLCRRKLLGLLQVKPVFKTADEKLNLKEEATREFELSSVSSMHANSIYNSDFVSTSASKFE